MKDCLNNKTIWITGASKGIGLALALKFSKESEANLVLSASSSESFEIIEDLFYPESTLFLPADLTKINTLDDVNLEIENHFGPVDILINNAGLGLFSNLADISIDSFDKLISVNLRGPFLAIKSVLPGMMERRSGIIVNIVSGAATKTYTGSSVYGASKAGLLAMSRSLREEVRQYGIKVIDILPGATATDMWGEEMLKDNSERMMEPEAIAKAVFNAVLLALSSNAVIEEMLIKPSGGDL